LLSILRAGLAAVAALTLVYPWSASHALGTAAGTNITNTATLTYSVAGTPATALSNAVTVRVDELINVRVTGPAAATAVITPDTNKVLLFTLTNVGNGPESFNLTPSLTVSGDQFNPTPGSAGQLFLDVNGNGQLDSGVDTPITGPLALNADQSARVLLVSNIPASLNSGDQGFVTLTAASTTAGAAGAAPGTTLNNLGTPAVGGGTVNAVVGAGPGGIADSGADDVANGAYLVAGVTVTIGKNILAVTSASGVTTTGCNSGSPLPACTVFVPGTIIDYQVTVTITGSGTAQAVQVIDNVPANTTYLANSIRFNSVARTDVVDADNASCAACGNATGAVSVVVGDVPVVAGTPVTHLIHYKVVIN